MFEFPEIFMNWLVSSEMINTSQKEALEYMWEELVHAWMMEKTIPTTIYMEYFDDDTKFNFILKKLCEQGYVKSLIDYNYATLELNAAKFGVTEENAEDIRYKYKFQYYMLTAVQDGESDTTKINGKFKFTGLVRKGFAYASQYVFKYATKYIIAYAPYIAKNIYKEISVTTKDIKYAEIVSALLDYYTIDSLAYTVNKALHDSRGRVIFKCTSKIFNPVSHKDARACILLEPYQITEKGIENVYAFIAELLGRKPETMREKIEYGKKAYENRTLPDLELMIMDDNFSQLHERIWLERIYENLDNLENGWVVPIECDATASMLQITAVILNDHEYMDYTNLINPEHLKDAWTIKGLTRNHVKKAVTPRLYGSSAEPAELWAKNNIPYTQDQINIVTKEIRTGRFKRANDFKDFIISNVRPKPVMAVRIWDEQFIVECNRFKLEETVPVTHTIYTSAQGVYRKCVHNEERVPDTNQFKRYFQTLLIHNLDSQVADYIAGSKELSFVIPNHDAFVVTPDDVEIVRKLYTSKLMEMYKDRKKIISNYLKSIGIDIDITFREDGEIEEFSGFALK